MDLEHRYWFFVRFVKSVLFMTALWPDGTKQSKISEIIYKKVSLLCDFITTIMFFAVSYFCYSHRDNLEILMRGASFLGTVTLMLVKVTTFVKERNNISELIDTLGHLSTTGLKDPKLKPHVLGLVTMLSRYAYVQAVTVGSTILFFMLIPAVIILYQKLSGINPVVYPYPFPSKFPWDIDDVGGIIYAFHYIFDVLVGWICFSSVVGVDSLFCLFVLQLCGQLRVLRFHFENLNPSSSDYKSDFGQCVQRHCILIRCRDILQKVYGVTILTQFLSNGLVMCALIFQASQMRTISVGKVLIFVFYMASKFVQALMYSWCGTLLTTESEDMRYGTFATDWIELSNPKLMRNVLMVICQRPLTLTACNFSIVSLRMLTSILHTTISYFFLLQTLDEQ